MLDLASYTPKGDKKNSDYFEEYLPKVYDRRKSAGLDQIVGDTAALVVQVEHGDGVDYLAELAAMGPYRLVAARLGETHKIYVLQSRPEFPRMIVLEPLTASYEDATTRWNLLYPLARKKPNARYIGEVYKAESTKAVREALEPHNVRFAYPGDTVSPFYALPHLTFTFMSDFTYNRVGYVDVDLDDLDELGLGEPISLTADEQGKLDRADALQAEHGIKDLVLGVDHAATRILAGDRENALLEYLTMVPYYFWGAYNINEMNSSTNVTRHPDIDDDKKSPARVFTANNTPSIVNSFENLPMPTEDFVRNFGRRMHHIAMAVIDGHVAEEKNVDYVVRQLSEMGTPFLAHVVGECKDDPNLKQIFSKSSPYSLLITEYVERCHGYEGFFTRDNVAALTAAAGADERYEHGHVFD
ncbi:hypothetical protein [Marmoricola sp. RAF53]|uniref:hypothetical protein n=1 Tax=Marmoricola sp. RAF53 TaxID=3233059 RepID=UPI003F9B8FCB